MVCYSWLCAYTNSWALGEAGGWVGDFTNSTSADVPSVHSHSFSCPRPPCTSLTTPQPPESPNHHALPHYIWHPGRLGAHRHRGHGVGRQGRRCNWVRRNDAGPAGRGLRQVTTRAAGAWSKVGARRVLDTPHRSLLFTALVQVVRIDVLVRACRTTHIQVL